VEVWEDLDHQVAAEGLHQVVEEEVGHPLVAVEGEDP